MKRDGNCNSGKETPLDLRRSRFGGGDDVDVERHVERRVMGSEPVDKIIDAI